MADRPNVVLCFADQLRAFALGCYGNPLVRTPNLDRLAREGFRFEQAVSNNPVCMPGRSCVLSGQYSRTCTGRLGNFVDRTLPPDVAPMPQLPVAERADFPEQTLPEALRAAGYRTGLVGKWHIHTAPEQCGFDWACYPYVSHRNSGQTYVRPDGGHEPVPGFGPEYELDQAAAFLAAGGGEPFFLFHNISLPHMPVADAPRRYLEMYDPAAVELRPNALVDGEPAWDENFFKIYLWDFLYYVKHEPHTEALPEGFDLRTLTALYYGMVTWTDDLVGELLRRLEAAGALANTIVVFTADHGDLLGSHHLFNKARLEEEAIRVPFLVWAPGRVSPGSSREQVASLIDVMPTVLDLCGLPAPEGVQGESLRPVLDGSAATAAREGGAFIETSGHRIGLRTPRYLYGLELDRSDAAAAQARVEQRILPEDPAPIDEAYACLHDVEADPYEYRNLLETGEAPAGTVRTLEARLRQWHAETPWLRRERVAPPPAP